MYARNNSFIEAFPHILFGCHLTWLGLCLIMERSVFFSKSKEKEQSNFNFVYAALIIHSHHCSCTIFYYSKMVSAVHSTKYHPFVKVSIVWLIFFFLAYCDSVKNASLIYKYCNSCNSVWNSFCNWNSLLICFFYLLSSIWLHCNWLWTTVKDQSC